MLPRWGSCCCPEARLKACPAKSRLQTASAITATLSDIRIVVFLFIAGSYWLLRLIGEAAIIPTREKGSNDKRGIPPTDVGGRSYSACKKNGAPALSESHQRSSWIVHTQPT